MTDSLPVRPFATPLPTVHASACHTTLSCRDLFVRAYACVSLLSAILDNGMYTLKSTSTVSAEIVKARLFPTANNGNGGAGEDDDDDDDEDASDSSAVEHWQEKSLDIYLSPPGRHVQPGSPSAVRIRQFNGAST